MKTQAITTPKFNTEKPYGKKNVSFTNAADLALRALEISPAWGAVGIDLGSMVIPRSAIDFTRGPAAGIETLRRESTSSANHALLGAYGLLASAALAPVFNKAFGVKGQKIFANDDAINIMGNAWAEQLKKNNPNPMKSYLEDIVSKMSGYTDGSWKAIDKETQKTVVNKILDELNTGSKSTFGKDSKALVKSLITASTGAESRFRLESSGNATRSSLDTMLDDIFSVSKSFKSEKVQKSFAEAADVGMNRFLKSLKSFNIKRSLLGVGIATVIGMSIQPLNRYLTKKKTGKSGFVGSNDRTEDKSTKFKALKIGSAGLFAAGVKGIVGGKLKDIPSKIQFHGMIPTIKQFQVLYGLTIVSRLLAARDKDELRESFIKDSLGFLNWLVLGNFVSKLTANALDKSLINYSAKEDGKGFFNWLTKSALKTRDEITHVSLKKAGISTIENGKALKFKELLKLIPDKATKTKLRYLNIAQFAGYLYSGLVLGVAIPKLNIAMSKSSAKKRHEQYQAKVFGQTNTAFLQNNQAAKFI